MFLLAQLADAFDRRTWIIIFLVCFGSPLFGSLIGALRRDSRIRRRWQHTALYYALAAGLFFGVVALREPLWLVIPFYLSMLSGPIIGLVLLFG